MDRVRITSGGNLGIGAAPGTYMFYNNGTSFFNNNIEVAALRYMNFATSGVGGTSGLSWTNNSDPAKIYVSETVSNKSEMFFQV